MKQGLTWFTNAINRRVFLRRTAAGIFGLASALSVGQRLVFASAPCTAPYGGGRCPTGACGSGTYSWECVGNYEYTCAYSTTTCNPEPDQCSADGSCWHPVSQCNPNCTGCNNCTCCDCYCCYPTGSCFYCYCYGPCPSCAGC